MSLRQTSRDSQWQLTRLHSTCPRGIFPAPCHEVCLVSGTGPPWATAYWAFTERKYRYIFWIICYTSYYIQWVLSECYLVMLNLWKFIPSITRGLVVRKKYYFCILVMAPLAFGRLCEERIKVKDKCCYLLCKAKLALAKPYSQDRVRLWPLINEVAAVDGCKDISTFPFFQLNLKTPTVIGLQNC